MIPWQKLHGASTHFPIALLLFSTGCDLLATGLWKKPFARELRATGFYSLLASVLGGLVAVTSGIAVTKGNLWGHGDLLWHHRFVWPAFGLLIFLVTWRIIVRENASNGGIRIYLVLMLIASGLMAGAGYWGGEMLIKE